MVHLLKGKYLHKLFKIFLHGKCFYSPFPIYLFMQSFICIRMGSCIFILYFGLLSNSALFCCSTFPSFGYWQLLQLALAFLWYTPSLCVLFFFCVLSTCLLSDPIKSSHSSYPFLASLLEPTISLRSLGYFYWKMIFKKRSGARHVIGVSLLPVSQVGTGNQVPGDLEQ